MRVTCFRSGFRSVSRFCFRSLLILILGSFLLFLPSAYAAAADTASAASQPAKPPSTYPQIVRLSYVEGDVRVSRGKEADKADSKEGGDATGWEQAAANLPLETGFSLVTGKGRAEIELEDASIVYLADNSVLTFNDLSATGGVPHTDMALLSGTASLNVQSMMPGESLILKTPTDNLAMRYPQAAFVRVNSYLDAIAITPQRDMTFKVPGAYAARPMVAAQTITLHNGRRVYAAAGWPGCLDRVGQMGGDTRRGERDGDVCGDERCWAEDADPRARGDEWRGPLLSLPAVRNLLGAYAGMGWAGNAGCAE